MPQKISGTIKSVTDTIKILIVSVTDFAEINTSKGKQAKQFVTRALKGCHPLVIKTHGTDKYARYLVDIFYLPNQPDANVVAAQGVFLNQQLLDEGLAVRYER
ncbi:MAG: thermonuclease family protein [Candidatus Omnitrophica bacterium]|nr:thermonuclease family protein [Candidatus Omnitrophota bacterium]